MKYYMVNRLWSMKFTEGLSTIALGLSLSADLMIILIFGLFQQRSLIDNLNYQLVNIGRNYKQGHKLNSVFM